MEAEWSPAGAAGGPAHNSGSGGVALSGGQPQADHEPMQLDSDAAAQGAHPQQQQKQRQWQAGSESDGWGDAEHGLPPSQAGEAAEACSGEQAAGVEGGGGWDEAGAHAQEQEEDQEMADHDIHSHELDHDAGPDHNRYQQQQQQQQPESEQQQPESPQQDPGQSPQPADQQAGEEEAGDAAAAAAADLQQQQQQQQQLNELEAVLRQADAVMEPDIMDRLRQYVVANGHPQAAVEYLTESYVGYAQMASLVCRWLKMSEPEDDGSAAHVDANAANAIANSGAAGSNLAPGGGTAQRADAKRAAAAAAAAAAAGDGKQEHHSLHHHHHQRVQLDEAFYLRQLAKERFDPQLFATVFTSGGSGAPQWLNGLIASSEGRSLVYELAGRFKSSLLLNFAIHKILMQPGREKEVAAVGGSLAGYFGVFHRLMAAKLREAAAAPSEAALAALARSLKEDCCASQHTYVHAQQVLAELARHPHGARFRRIAQELEQCAAAAHGPVVWKMRQWFAEPGGSESQQQVAALLSDILATSVSGVPPASEMSKLYRLYWPQEPGQQPPPISLLRHPRVFEVLLQGLFSPARQLQPEVVAAYSGLLALAAAADDRRPSTATAAAAASSPAGDGEQRSEQGAGPPHAGADADGLLDLSAVPATRQALEAAAELALSVMQDQKSSPDELERAAAVLEYPCCAAGLLRAMDAQLTRPEYWQTAYHLLKSPPFLSLLALLVPRQPALHDGLLSLLGRALTALGNSNHDMAKGFLSVAVQLVSAGRVFEVLRWAEEWKQRADPSLVRHLVFGILEVSAPPYSPEFAGSMLRIMQAAGIRRQRLSARDWAIKALLDEFAAACAQVHFKPPLSTREALFLQEVSADRPPGY